MKEESFISSLFPQGIENGISPEKAAAARERMRRAMAAVDKVYEARRELREELGDELYKNLGEEEIARMIGEKIKERDEKVERSIKELTS